MSDNDSFSDFPDSFRASTVSKETYRRLAGSQQEGTPPVYVTDPGGSQAVPSGLVFVRFGEKMSARDHEGAIAAAGYEIVEVPPYALHAAWVRARDGSIPTALNGVERLEAIDGVENVEPQMLRPRSLR
jgi:hypothetical protein